MSGRAPRIAHALFAAAALLPALAAPVLTGCAVKPATRASIPATPERSWSGQLRYRNADRTAIGSFAARSRGPSDFDLDFFAGPGVTLLRVETRPGRVRASGPLSRGTPKRRWLLLAERFAALNRMPEPFEITLASGESFHFRAGSQP